MKKKKKQISLGPNPSIMRKAGPMKDKKKDKKKRRRDDRLEGDL